MRRSILIILAIPAMLIFPGSACQKISNQTQQDGLTGSWELYALEGGIASMITYPPGNGNTYHFFANGTFMTSGSAGSGTGTYRLARASIVNDDKILTLTSSVNSAVTRDSVRISDGELSFLPTESCCDAAYYVYRRTSYF